MTPLERADQALDGWAFASCLQENPDCPGGLDCPVNKREAVLAVLTAIREPSEADVGRVYEEGHWNCAREEIGAIHTAMIDALLADEA